MYKLQEHIRQWLRAGPEDSVFVSNIHLAKYFYDKGYKDGKENEQSR